MSIKEIKLSGLKNLKNDEQATHGFIAVGSYNGEVDWDNIESDGPQPTIEEAIAVASRYGWEPPFFIAEVNIVAKVVE